MSKLFLRLLKLLLFRADLYLLVEDMLYLKDF